MKIGIDVRMIFPFPTGIGNYRMSTMDSLLKLDCVNEYILIGNEDSIFKPNEQGLLTNSVEKNILQPHWENIYQNKNITFQIIKSKANHPLQHIFLRSELKKLNLDVYWTNPWGATLNIPCPYVITIHDLLYRRYPQFHSWKSWLFQTFLEKRIAKKATAIATISEFAKDDIVNFLNVDGSKVFNTSEGASSEYRIIEDESFISKVLQKYNLNVDSLGNDFYPYFVYMGNRRPHKNLVGLLKAFELFNHSFLSKRKGRDGLKEENNIKLVIIGGVDAKGRDKESVVIQEQIQKMKFKDQVLILGKVFDNNEVAAIFNKAIAMVHPSLHEGFGLTPLEAMRCGCPIIASNTTAIPEVVGEAGILVNPSVPEEIAEAMNSVYIDMDLRKTMHKNSFEQSKMFSWEKTANIMLDILTAL